MRKPRPRHIFYATIFVESVLFVLGAFLANYLISAHKLRTYATIAAVLFILYFAYRLFVLRDDWYRIKTFETLSDNVARSAESYGVRRFYNMQIPADQDQRNADTQIAIAKANSMFLCANSGASYLNAAVVRHRPLVVEKLKAGCGFQVLLLDPLSGEKRLRDAVNVAGELTDSKLSLGDIIRLCNEFARLDVRFIDRGMTCSLFFADDVLFFDPYHLAFRDGRVENRFLCLQMFRMQAPAGLSYFDLFRIHRDVLWERGTQIEEWLPANRARLEAELNIRELPQLRRARGHAQDVNQQR
ncbi:MAG: hypothetical protein WCC22_00020 [Terriglobales bacterium]